MAYKKKIAVLSAAVIVLALVYILSFVFDPERRQSTAFAWLDPSLLVMADGIEIYGTGGVAGGITLLSRKDGTWFFSSGITDFPVKQHRVEDLLNALSRKDVYPLRAVSAEAIERLGLAEESSSRIRIRGGAGLPLLDLLIGGGDALGREVYLRRVGRNEIHSGEDRFTFYIDARPSFWYDLRLFPQEIADIGAVQQAEIALLNEEPFILRRSGGGWIMVGQGSALDTRSVEAWLRSVLEAEADDFGLEPPALVEGSITLRFGDGTTRTIEAGPADEDNNRSLRVLGSGLVYVLTEWTFSRLFRESSFFGE